MSCPLIKVQTLGTTRCSMNIAPKQEFEGVVDAYLVAQIFVLSMKFVNLITAVQYNKIFSLYLN